MVCQGERGWWFIRGMEAGGLPGGWGRDVYQEDGGCSSVVCTFQFGVVPLDWPGPREGLWRPQEALPGAWPAVGRPVAGLGA